MRSIIPRLEALLPEIREKLRLDGNKRFMLLLVFFNALLIAILLLSVRNNEISYRIINVEESITRIVQRRETLVASQTRIVFITATPTYNAIAAATSTPTPTQAPPTATQTPTRRPSSTPRPSNTPQPTNIPTAQPTETAVPTQTSVPTATSVLPTPTETAIATPTWTSVPPTPVPPTQPPPPTATPTNTPTNTPTATPTNTPTNTPTATPDIDSLTLSAVPPNIFATGISTTTISADVRDSGGFAVSDGTIVTFNTSSGSFPSGTSTTAPTSGGIAQAILTSSTTAGIAIVDASAVAASDSITVTFDPGGPATVVLTASPSSIPADGVTTTTLQATVTDAYGNPVADGTTVDFVTTLGTLSALSATTSGGIATVTLSSTNAGQADVTASSGTPADTVTVNLTHLLQITKVIDRADAPAGSTRTYTITVQNNTTGGVPAEVTVVSDTMAAGFGYVGGSTISPGFGEPTINGQALTWTPGAPPYNLAAGASFSLSFQVTTNVPAGPYWNNASVQGNNFATISTGSTAQVTLQSPVLGPMSPNAGCNDVAVPVTMVGNYFSPGATARLGTWDLGATWTSETLLNGTVPVDIPVGVYDLTVTNPGGASSTLVGAYTAQDCSSLDTTLESGYLATIGREVGLSSELGDNDSIQELFLEVPASTPGPIYIRVFDPDCGGTLDRQAGFDWNTPFTYTVYGAGGTQLLTQSFGENPATDGLWYNLGSFAVSSGELRGSSRVFRLRIEGGPEPPFPLNTLTVDTNLYNVAVSTSDVANVSPPGARIFAYSWTYLIPQAEWMTPSRMYPYVDGGVSTLIQHNFDYDNTAAGTAGIDVLTPLRTLTGNDSDVSGDAAEVTSSFSPIAGEENTTWTISVWAEPTGGLTDNIVIFWATDQGGRTLALFARSTNLPPPP